MEDKGAILVTGGAGYIGSHATLALLDAGWTVVVIDDLSTGFESAVPKAATFYHADIADTDRVATILKEHYIRAIMHFAGSVVVSESVERPMKYYLNNTAKSAELINCAMSAGVEAFIFSSTAAVYGSPDQDAVDEDAEKKPINPYGRSKLMTEQMLRDASTAGQLKACVLRYFNVAGADPLGRTGQSTAGATHLIKVACEVVTGQRPVIEIFGSDFDTPDGTGIRDYIHVSDLADAHVRALDYLLAGPSDFTVMNCGYGRGFSVAQVLDAVDRVAGTTIERRFGPRRAGDPAQLIAEPQKARTLLGWQPRHDDLDTIVRHALAWERDRGGAR